jgi:hypothetical protein
MEVELLGQISVHACRPEQCAMQLPQAMVKSHG